MEIVKYITVNILLFASWYILLFRKKYRLPFIDRILGCFVLGLAQIVLTEMVLGVLFKKLFTTPLFILNISISLGVLILAAVIKQPATTGPASNGEHCGKNSIIPCLLTDIFKELKDKIRYFFNILKSDWMLLVIFILFSVSFCYLIFIGYLFPSYSWDALFYHLPIVGFILQSGAIETPVYNSLIYTMINIFPKNINLFFVWNIIFLKSDVIVDLSQMFFTMAGMLSVYSIAVKLNIKEKYAVYSSLLFFFAPIIILQSTANYVDIAVSVLFLIAMNFLMHDSREQTVSPEGRNTQALLLAGITAGILLGAKGSGPLFVFALSALFLINELKIRFSLKHKSILCPAPGAGQPDEDVSGDIVRQYTIKRIILRYAFCFVMPVILLGSYSYIKNWIVYNNPLYPMVITVFGKTLFNGMFTEMLNPVPDAIKNLSPFVSPFYVWLEKVEYYYYASDSSGFGPLWFILFLPGVVFSVLYAIWKKRYDFLLIALIIIFVFLVYPKNWNTRYVIFLYGLGSLAFGILLEFFGKRGKVLKFLALLLAGYVFLVSNSFCITPEKIREFIRLPAGERSLVRMEPCILGETQREDYGLWAWIDNNISSGDTLAYTFTPNLLGPLWNSSFSNKIVFVKAGNFDEWIKGLEANNADYVLVLSRPRSMEHWWLTKLAEQRNSPEWAATYARFSLMYSDRQYLVMRFR